MSISGLPSASSPLLSGSVVPDALPAPSTDAAMPLLPVEQSGKPASADWLSTYKPTFNDARESASEPDEPAADGTQEAEGGQSDTVEADAVAAVDDGQDAHDGQGGDADSQDGDGDGGSQQGSSDAQGDSSDDQQGERGGGDRSGERHRDPEPHAGQTAAELARHADAPQGRQRQHETGREGPPAVHADRTLSSAHDGGDGATQDGNRFVSQGPQMERPGTRTPTEWLTDPASGALRAAVVAAGQRIVAERASTPRRVGAAQRTHETEQADRLTLTRRVREAEAFIQQRDQTASDGAQDAE